MNVDRYLQYVPVIEQQLRDLKLDTIVFGMGPTAWLLPWLDQRLLQGIRVWTCHDGCRIYPAHDLVLMDAPSRALHPDTTRYASIVASRPQRIWIYDKVWNYERSPATKDREAIVEKQWAAHLSQAVHGVVTRQPWTVWNPDQHPKVIKPKLDRVDKNGAITPDTIAVSPTGAVTLAWALGSRRIGVLGMDMMKDHHHSWVRHQQVDQFMVAIADQAHLKGGGIFNLSPVTSLKRFAAWKSSTSGSEPTVGSEMPEPSAPLSTASSATPITPSRSTGCDLVTPGGKSPQMAATEPGPSAESQV